jgi:hypothetical protein
MKRRLFEHAHLLHRFRCRFKEAALSDGKRCGIDARDAFY